MSQQNNQTIAKKLHEFEARLKWFDSEDFTLEEALIKYKEAEEIAKEIEMQLESINNEVSVLKQKFSE